MNNGKNLPKDVIDLWPEVFGDITPNVVPVKYLQAISISFKNNKTWEIRLSKSQKLDQWSRVESHLKEVVAEYETEIENINFKLDTTRIKKDITVKTKKFLKNRKLK